MSYNININVTLDAYEVANARQTYSELLEFMFDIDKEIADVGFTEDLIKGLIKSLRSDMTEYELIDFINTLKSEL